MSKSIVNACALAAGLLAAGGAAQAQPMAQVDGMRFALPVYAVGKPAPAAVAAPATHSRSDATATSASQGGSVSIDSHAVYQAQERAPVSTAVAPSLSSSNDTCMGSSSFGAQAVSFGLSFGSNWTDENCLMLKNAREMWNMGFRGAALARLCMDTRNRNALEATGVACPSAVAGGRP